MLKIKANVDLKELEKYGFEIFNNNTARKIYYDIYDSSIHSEDDTYFIIEHREIWFVENGAKYSNERYFGNPQFDDLYDLIKADLVEKVSDE